MEVINSIKQILGLSSESTPQQTVEVRTVRVALGYMKEHIKRRTADSRHVREQINASKGMERWHLWNEKRDIGFDARDCLLAYGCLRGRQYMTIEAKCALGNEPSPSSVLVYIHSFLGREGPEAESWTKEKVKAWLKRPELVGIPSKAEVAA